MTRPSTAGPSAMQSAADAASLSLEAGDPMGEQAPVYGGGGGGDSPPLESQRSEFGLNEKRANESAAF